MEGRVEWMRRDNRRWMMGRMSDERKEGRNEEEKEVKTEEGNENYEKGEWKENK